MKLIEGQVIWDATRVSDREHTRLENPSLVRFRDAWYCAVSESPTHNPHPSSRRRILRSENGENWETVKVFEWDAGAVGVGLSVTPEGRLMASGQVYFVSKTPRPDLSNREKTPPPEPPVSADGKKADPNPMVGTPFCHYQLNPIGTVLNLPDNDQECGVTNQFTSWFSDDGKQWSSAFCPPNMVNTQPFRVTWHNGMGYVIGQWGKDMCGPLYRTRDGKHWRVLLERFAPQGRCNEGSIAFGGDDTAYCLYRDGTHNVMLGQSAPPFYQHWEWSVPAIDYGVEAGGPRPAGEVLQTSLGGPLLKRLSDGSLLGSGRALGPQRDDGRATLFMVDPQRSVLTVMAEFDGTSYPSFAEYDGRLWVAYIGSACHQGRWEVHLATLPLALRT